MLPILEIQNISKQYRLGYVGTGSLGHDIHRWWCNVRGKEDPYLKIGEENNRTQVGTSEYVWALRDINLQVQAGEVLGIIGANGAGKSTLLKILSRVTGPTTGKITARGRIASLLEVGTGFHGELTGRENIYLNGAILGMTKKEITSKLDEIIDFSGCERYIDTPVKRYSSGMYVRLAFAVAAHLEPEILIVDEVLAVGDAEFQKKAIGKMKDVSSGQGRTVLFVSHNMTAVESLCTRSILLENGRNLLEGDTKTIINQYLTKNFNEVTHIDWEKFHCIPQNENVALLNASILKSNSDIIYIDTPFKVIIEFINYVEEPISINLICRLFSNDVVFEFPIPFQKFNIGKNRIEYTLPPYFLNANMYTFQINFSKVGPKTYFYKEKILVFEIHNKLIVPGFHQKLEGIIVPQLQYKITNENV